MQGSLYNVVFLLVAGLGTALACGLGTLPVFWLGELNFFSQERCGKCTPCRVGGQRARQILTHLAEVTGKLINGKEIEVPGGRANSTPQPWKTTIRPISLSNERLINGVLG